MNELIRDVKATAKGELIRAVMEHGYFASAHEGNDVIREELDEAIEEFKIVSDCKNELSEAIHQDDESKQMTCIRAIIQHCEFAIAESVQVLAMAYKYRLYLDGIKCKRETIPITHKELDMMIRKL